MSSAMLTVGEVAKRLRVSRNTVYGLVENERIGHIRIGTGRGTIRITEDDLASFIESCRAERRAASTPLRHLA